MKKLSIAALALVAVIIGALIWQNSKNNKVEINLPLPLEEYNQLTDKPCPCPAYDGQCYPVEVCIDE